MADPSCCVCGGLATGKAARHIRLNESEKETIRKTGQTPPDEFVYCRACMAILSNPETGAQLMKGVLQTKLRAAGVADAEKRAQMFYNFCIKHAATKPVS